MRGILFCLAALIAAPASATELGVWAYSKKVDEFTDETKHFAMVIVQLGPRSAGSMIVRCVDNDLEVLANVGQFLTTDGHVKIKYRFDDGAVVEERWGISTTGKFVFSPSPREFAGKLMAANTLLFRAHDYSGTAHDARYPMTGSAQAIKQVLNACGT